MSRLVVVSNRVAPVNESKGNTGGLAVAMLAALRKSGGIWFGWSGERTRTAPTEPHLYRVGRLTYATVDLTQRDLDEYYNGFANSVLWPAFHYRLDLMQYSRRNFGGYRRVNALFGRMLAPLLQPDDLIWVHDYHLVPMADELRRAGVGNRIGFFLHTPFPAPEILAGLPEHDMLVRWLCAYDLVGFQAESDRHAFCEYVVQCAGGHVDGHTVRAFGRTVRVETFPIGLDTDVVMEQAQASARSRHTERLRLSLAGRGLIIGVDRLDYSKGIPQRFAAFEKLLETYPSNRGRVTMMQIAPPSRIDVPEYIDMRRQLESMAGAINGRFAEFDWMPLRYLNKGFNRRTLAGFLRASRVGLITPLRDGMNLVAKEYVAAQDGSDPGVLVLSRFAGAASELGEALIVNPYDAEGVADALQQALEMPLDERRERWSAMLDRLRRCDVTAWRTRFVEALAEPLPAKGAA